MWEEGDHTSAQQVERETIPQPAQEMGGGEPYLGPGGGGKRETIPRPAQEVEEGRQ